jgi:hypothetical protein
MKVILFGATGMVGQAALRECLLDPGVPAFIRPMHGITSRTRSYRILYAMMRPIVPLIALLFPGQMTTTERIGRAMLNVARRGSPKAILESADIDAAAQ